MKKRKFLGWKSFTNHKIFFVFWVPVYKKENRLHVIEELLHGIRRELKQIKYITLPALVKHAHVFEKYRAVHRGENIVIVGAGPSLDAYTPMPNAIHIGVNRTYQNPKLELDYLFMQDGGTNMNRHGSESQDLLQYRVGKCKKFFGRNVHNPISEAYIEKSGAEVYYLEESCAENPYSMAVPELSIQPFCCSSSVILVAFQFALWCNPRRIYVVGCDTANNGYHKADRSTVKQDLWIDGLMLGWQQMADFARRHYPDIEIISINPVGLKGMFTDATMIDGKLEISTKNC